MDLFLQTYIRGPVLGRGSTGPVFRVKSRKTGESFACKMIEFARLVGETRSEEAVTQAAAAELNMLTDASHSSFVEVVDFYLDQKRCVIVMELLEGGSLEDHLDYVAGCLSEQEAKTVMRSLVEGLAFLHSKRIAHRDMKLANVMLVKPNDVSRVKIVDLGMAKPLRTSASSCHTVCGSPLYISPETVLEAFDSPSGVMKAGYDNG
eukprot:scaffold346995_cov42-Prasinocladus_malaysianus.AAC.1